MGKALLSRRLKNFILAIALVCSLAVMGVLAATAPAYAVDSLENKLNCGSNIALEGGNCSVGSGTSTVQSTIRRIISVLSAIVGAIAVIMLMVGGFRYVVSGGDANATKSARDTVIYALVGLVIVAIAQAIVQFVLRGATRGV